MTARRVTTVLAAALIATSTVSCSAPSSTESDGVVDSARYVELYREAVADFPEKMPDGVGFPEDPPRLSGEIGIGNAAGAAYFHWNCAWMDIYLTSDDQSLRDEAMHELERLPHTEWAMRYLEDPEGIWSSVLQAAELGDLSEFRAFYEMDCQYYRATEDEWSAE